MYVSAMIIPARDEVAKLPKCSGVIVREGGRSSTLQPLAK
jgi:hypothetical protein